MQERAACMSLEAIERRLRSSSRDAIMETVDNRQEQKSGLTTVGLFAGIGGLEKGLSEACHKTILLVEIDEAANAVLKAQFPKIRRRMDVRKLKALPKSTELL